MRVVVIYESLTGNTERAAHMMAEAARDQGAEATALPEGIDAFVAHTLALAPA